MRTFFRKAFEMYRDGFKSMTIGRTLWLVIAIKLVIIFLILKVCFFPNKLNTEYSNDDDRAQAVLKSLTAK